jgi:hypothetical protein
VDPPRRRTVPGSLRGTLILGAGAQLRSAALIQDLRNAQDFLVDAALQSRVASLVILCLLEVAADAGAACAGDPTQALRGDRFTF